MSDLAAEVQQPVDQGSHDRSSNHELTREQSSDGEASRDESVSEETPETAPDHEPTLPETGNATVDAALRRLRDVEERSPADQVEVYDDVHRQLQDALADASTDRR